MKILILGRGKSGTTALLFKMASGLPNCQVFSGGHPGEKKADSENVIFKYTYSERKGKTFEVYRRHIAGENYDRKIWMARDPRDVAVSRTLFVWHKGTKGNRRQYKEYLRLLEQKERDPMSIPFHVLCRYTELGRWPLTTEEVVEGEATRHQRMSDFVKSLGSDWLVFKYEDMLAHNYQMLNTYLGFEVSDTAQVPSTTVKSKVARKKGKGDWRSWFTDEDIRLFRPAYLPYLNTIGYDGDDWTLQSEPGIEPEFSSMYVKRLVRQNTKNRIRKFPKKLFRT
ncbi:MAG: hypothetical protein P8X90_07585 [Desulfobacterales bacterium]|jgi:hypothetical protein